MNKMMFALFMAFVMAFSMAASTVLLVDASGSMDSSIRMANGSYRKKIDVAKDAGNVLLDSVRPGDEIALIVFYDCNDIRTEVPFTTNTAQVRSKLNAVEPDNYTPIAGAIKYADNYISTSGRSKASIVLLTDGDETCGGEPISAATNATSHGYVSMINVVGFDIGSSSAAQQLQQVATAGGGNYYSANDTQQLTTALTSAYQTGTGGGININCCPSTIGLLALAGFAVAGRR